MYANSVVSGWASVSAAVGGHHRLHRVVDLVLRTSLDRVVVGQEQVADAAAQPGMVFDP